MKKGLLSLTVIGNCKMEKIIRTPFFEIGIKNYLYGDEVEVLAKAADRAAVQYDVDVLMIVPYADIRRVTQSVEKLIVFAPYMDSLYPGRGMADILPESIRSAGAKGVVLNHCEKRMTLSELTAVMHRAEELDLLTFSCADKIQMGRSLAYLHPDIINPEPTELIGSGNISDESFIRETMKAIHEVDPCILVEQAAGISKPQQVYDLICAGAQGVGVASGICTAQNPCGAMEEMVKAVRAAVDEMAKLK